MITFKIIKYKYRLNDNMSRSIKELGDTQRCPKCKQFGKMIALKVSAKTAKALYLCEKCVKNYSEDYTIEEFAIMGNGFLLDDKWIHDFQRKYMVSTSEFVQIKNGLDGAYFSKSKSIVKNQGKELICKCGEFYKLEFKGSKKDTLFLNKECDICGKSKLKISARDFFLLSDAGIVPAELTSVVKDHVAVDKAEWTSEEEYYTPSTVLSSEARSRLGMEEDTTLEELGGFVCEKCGAAINIEMKKFGRCPTCGNPLKK